MEHIKGRILSISTSMRKGEKKKNSVELADLFCRQARDRVKILFKESCHNHDKLSSAIAKKLLADKYDWLENDIIK